MEPNGTGNDLQRELTELSKLQIPTKHTKSATAALTITIPTFNRTQSLGMMLEALKLELCGQERGIAVVIGDNNSSDNTFEVASTLLALWPNTLILHRDRNLGSEENFCRHIELVESRYFWIIGDDDLQRAEAIALQAFARNVHIWTTFAIVVRAFTPNAFLRKYSGSQLVQLGWILRALREVRRFVYVTEPWVLATAGNTGGYNALKIFENNFQLGTREALSNNLTNKRPAEAMLWRGSVVFLLNLIWGIPLKGHSGVAYNIGAEETVSITQLAHRFWQVLGSDSRIKVKDHPRPSVKPARYVPLCSKARKHLGLATQLALEEANIRTAKWYSPIRGLPA